MHPSLIGGVDLQPDCNGDAGASDLVVDTFTLTPPAIERYFGITRGHIHHIDNSFGFDDRFPYRMPVQASLLGARFARAKRHGNNHQLAALFRVQGLYSCSAGTHPGGSVVGCAGHNAAAAVIKDLGLRQWWQVPGSG